eukprot:TRINITY_DN912_c0_g1_i3.p1 TRINITY_DN912_c0_g1~~TRINITY_DN912_c0_g1_i3.p1  ORF type:complete len:376 (-),score=91.88 TRINITY_DN912_c0_g1_i3:60-1187(-)
MCIRDSINPIYLDMQATTPIDYRVADSMLPFLTAEYGNPGSPHDFGELTKQHVEQSRNQIGKAINCSEKDIVFTSGATESTNIILKGLANFYGKLNKKHIITSKIEHKSVLDSCKELEQRGFSITYLDVKPNGLVDLKQLEKSIRKETLCISIMHVNNEIGVIQPLEEIGKICKKKNVFFHTDIAQSLGKVPVDIQKMNINLCSITGHKLYGPKGIGALYISRKPRIHLTPIITGGGQERNIRSGTLSPFLIVGLGKAIELSVQEMKRDNAHIKILFDQVITELSNYNNIKFNGDLRQRFQGNINFTVKNVNVKEFRNQMKNFAFSSGAACIIDGSQSYVLSALGNKAEDNQINVRIGIGRFTTQGEITPSLIHN